MHLFGMRQARASGADCIFSLLAQFERSEEKGSFRLHTLFIETL